MSAHLATGRASLAARVRAALTRLNWDYGRGDVLSVCIRRRTFVVKPFSCRPESRRFRFDGRTVYAWGHQTRV